MTRAVLLRLTLVCAVAAALAGCGRKGPLDPPPVAAAATPAEQPAAGPLTPPLGAAARPPAPAPSAPPNRPFALDPLLN